MAGGYMGKLLFVDLSKGTLTEEPLEERMCRDFVGCQGIGVRVLYERMQPGIDPLGPDNILGFVSGPLTGTPAIAAARYVVVGKSPLTGAWGEANSAGDFGAYLKFAGFDGIFFSGISPRPVYLGIEDGEAALHDAARLWGRDTQDIEDMLQAEHGMDARVACIGPAGEKKSLLAAIINDKGRAAARAGLGAVMGSKLLKAIVVRGGAQVPMADAEKARRLHPQWAARIEDEGLALRKYGTSVYTADYADIGDSPVRNWTGAAREDFPTVRRIADDSVIAEQERPYGCWQCTIACGGHMKAKQGRLPVSHKPEYETLAMTGTNCLNDDLDSIIRVNDICNAQGLDTISIGATAAFAIECYRNEIITADDTGGLELNWRDGESIVALAGKIARREDIGDVLADGVMRAAERLGKGAEAFAVHSHGQELPAHDPKFVPSLAVSYRMDAAPGRHTLGGASWVMGVNFMEDTRPDKYQSEGFGDIHRKAMSMFQTVNAVGVCRFAYNSHDVRFITDFLEAVTGREHSLEQCIEAGERIATLRHMFNLREGLNPLDYHMNGRAIGKPSLAKGPLAGVTVDDKALLADYLRIMDWNPETARPSEAKLRALGLDDLTSD